MFSQLQNFFKSLVSGVKNKSTTHTSTTDGVQVDPDNNDSPRTLASALPVQVQKPSQSFEIATTAATDGDSKRGIKRTRTRLYESIKSEESERDGENASAGQSIASRLRSRRKFDNNADVKQEQATRSSEAYVKEESQGEEGLPDTDTTRSSEAYVKEESQGEEGLPDTDTTRYYCPYKSCTSSSI
ncbi:hypothetical protein BDB00DRAFT_936742, partial [Zychaea mexicana]|uniref:uncharacterized protein n=1 Tax=Zychaea mexicana TaxID=64656 RepID=UPI0022FE7CE8